MWKLDRLARLMKQLVQTVQALQLKNIGSRSLTEALAQERLVFHLFGALAGFERSLVRERTQAGEPPLGVWDAREDYRLNKHWDNVASPSTLANGL